MCTVKGIECMPQHMWGGQRTAYSNQSSPSTCGSWDPTRIMRTGRKCLYPESSHGPSKQYFRRQFLLSSWKSLVKHANVMSPLSLQCIVQDRSICWYKSVILNYGYTIKCSFRGCRDSSSVGKSVCHASMKPWVQTRRTHLNARYTVLCR